ncbi:MAG: SsrA-binding protein SmpB [Actinobacteria bacterium]|nr:SsrA-binding protein SmpB [Actinomycetota bacterium]
MDKPEIKVVASNRAARHNYHLLDEFEAGIVLRGSEVKALREAQVQIKEAFCQISNNEMWIHNLHIAPYSFSQSHSGHAPLRVRKLLLNRREIEKIRRKQMADRLSIVPTRIYFKDGKAKVEIALGKGKTKGDRRQDIAKKDAERDVRNEVGRRLKYGG